MQDDEREPLLGTRNGEDSEQQVENKQSKQGPLEISRTTRYGILAGIWAATFLSVCRVLSTFNPFNAQHHTSVPRFFLPSR